MSDTPIYDQMIREQERPGTPIGSLEWQEIGYLSEDGISLWNEANRHEEVDLPSLKTATSATAHFKVTEWDTEALTLLYGYDPIQLRKTTREWLAREKPTIPRFKRAWVTSSRRMPLTAKEVQANAERIARAAGLHADDVVDYMIKLGLSKEIHRRPLGKKT